MRVEWIKVECKNRNENDECKNGYEIECENSFKNRVENDCKNGYEIERENECKIEFENKN